jgi:hypothetical protein
VSILFWLRLDKDCGDRNKNQQESKMLGSTEPNEIHTPQAHTFCRLGLANGLANLHNAFAGQGRVTSSRTQPLLK